MGALRVANVGGSSQSRIGLRGTGKSRLLSGRRHPQVANPKLSVDEALTHLARNGHLVKRPFALTPKAGVAGFREEEWERFA